MPDEARLVQVANGSSPADDGWFVVNARDIPWVGREPFGQRGRFELDGRIAAGTEYDAMHFDQVGVTLAVLEPGKPSSMYHGEAGQEDFLVLAGECLAIVEGEERQLRQWDLLHCPPWTNHVLVGTGDGPCVVLMVGARVEGGIVYPVSELAARYAASVEEETRSPHEAYAAYAHWAPVDEKPKL